MASMKSKPAPPRRDRKGAIIVLRQRIALLGRSLREGLDLVQRDRDVGVVLDNVRLPRTDCSKGTPADSRAGSLPRNAHARLDGGGDRLGGVRLLRARVASLPDERADPS